MVLTDWQKRCFIRDGYIILRGAVPTPLVESALEAATASYRANKYDLEPQGVAPRFHEEALKHPDIGEIPEKTIIKEACEDLLGAGNVRWGGKAQIAFRLRDEKSVKKGMGMTDLIPRKMYHVDGATGEHSNLASAFTILVGVALSKGQMADENRGQLHVWPGMYPLVSLSGLMRLICNMY